MGLRGTGSHHVSVSGKQVPREHMAAPVFDPAPVFSGNPIQRCFRDIHTGNQHIIFSSNRDESFSKLQFGIDQATYTI